MSSKTPGAVLVEDASVTIALFGYPYWSDGEVAQIAAEQGHGDCGVGCIPTFRQRHAPTPSRAVRYRCLRRERREGAHRNRSAGHLSDGYSSQWLERDCIRNNRHGRREASGNVRGSVSPQGVFNYLFLYRVPAPTSIFEGQEKMLPAQYVLFTRGQIDTGFYWQMPFEASHKIGFSQLKRNPFRAVT